MRNVLIADTDEITDQEAQEFFWTDGEINSRETDLHTLEDLAVFAGIFKSKSQARSNGMTGPIPSGVSRQGTKKKWVWVWRHPRHFDHAVWWEDFWKETNFLCRKIDLKLKEGA